MRTVHRIPLVARLLALLIGLNTIAAYAEPPAAPRGPAQRPPVYQRRGGWSGPQYPPANHGPPSFQRYRYADPYRQPYHHGYVPPYPPVAAPAQGFSFQRPYPFHLDYYKMRYGGSYEPYQGFLYGTPQVYAPSYFDGGGPFPDAYPGPSGIPALGPGGPLSPAHQDPFTPYATPAAHPTQHDAPTSSPAVTPHAPASDEATPADPTVQ